MGSASHIPFVGGGEAALQQAARPGDDGQRDPAPQLLEEPDQRRVGHPPGAGPVHLQQDVPTPSEKKSIVSLWWGGGPHSDSLTPVNQFATGSFLTKVHFVESGTRW